MEGEELTELSGRKGKNRTEWNGRNESSGGEGKNGTEWNGRKKRNW